MYLASHTVSTYVQELGLDRDVLTDVLDLRSDQLYLSRHQKFILDAIAAAVHYDYAPAAAVHSAKGAGAMLDEPAPEFNSPSLWRRDIRAVTDYAVRTNGRLADDQTERNILDAFRQDWGQDFRCDFGSSVEDALPEQRRAIVQVVVRALAEWKGHEAYHPGGTTSSLFYHLIKENLDTIWSALMEIPCKGSANRNLDAAIMHVISHRHASEMLSRTGVDITRMTDEQRVTALRAVYHDLMDAGFDPPARAGIPDIHKVLSSPATTVWEALRRLMREQ